MQPQPLTDELSLGRSTIPTHSSWNVYDSTKIQTFQFCPRHYFYSYILGWRPEEININLHFGKAWHAAMEVLQILGHTPAGVHAAYEAFLHIWEEQYPSSPSLLEDPPHKTKNSHRALDGLIQYAKTWVNDDPTDLLYTEVCGTAPISENRVIYFKMDSIRRQPSSHTEAGKIFSLEHKTTGKTYLKTWEESWSYLFQVACYNYALFSMVDDYNEVDGVTVNGAIFHPRNTRFQRIPVRKSLPLLQDWLDEANYYIDEIERNMSMLAEASPSDRTMFAFPKASSPCSQRFGGCPFSGRCSLHANPLQHLHRLPSNHKVDHWDPREREKTAKKVVHLEQEEKLDA